MAERGPGKPRGGKGGGPGGRGGGKPGAGKAGGPKRAGGKPWGPPSGARSGGTGRPGGQPHLQNTHAELEPAMQPERMVYGRHPVREALRGQRPVRVVHVTASARKDLLTAIETADRIARRKGSRIELVDAEPARLRELCGTSDHQGVVAAVDPFPYCTIDEMLNDDAKAERIPLVLCLDQVTDPHNLGAIARVADASGASGLLVPEHRSASVTAAAVKASAGALEHVRIARCTNLADTIARVKGPELWAYAATERGRATHTQTDLSTGILLILGAEGPGVRPRVLANCDEQVRIPMSGSVASLNVATTAAILAFEAVRQRGELPSE